MKILKSILFIVFIQLLFPSCEFKQKIVKAVSGCNIEDGSYIEENKTMQDDSILGNRNYLSLIYIGDSKYQINLNGKYLIITHCDDNEISLGANNKYLVFKGKRYDPIDDKKLSDMTLQRYLNR